MIERIVLLKLKRTYSTPQAVREIIDHSIEVLSALPGVRHVHAGEAADEPTSSDWDMSLVLHFDSVEDVEPYRVHPDHRSYVDQYLIPRIETIRAISFVSAGLCHSKPETPSEQMAP